MSNKNSGIVSSVLKALLEGQVLNRKSFNNGSLHSWVSTLRNQRYIPIESIKTHDGTSDYVMKPEEIARYKNPDLREGQRAEMKVFVDNRRRQQAIKKLQAANALH